MRVNNMNISELIKKAHDNACLHGFYNCPNCRGDGIFDTGKNYESCPDCNCTGINQNKNIGELLMLIVSELGEALEAHRKNKFANLDDMKMAITESGWLQLFKHRIKDTFEDELADVCIRLFDLCGYLNIDLEKHIELKMQYNETREYKHGKNY